LVFWMGSSMYLKRPPETKSQVQKSPQEKSADRNTLLRIIVVLSPIVIFWALFYQLNTSWVQQGEKMAKTSVLGYVVDGQSMQTASGILILILVPFMVIVGYPFMRKIGLPTSMIGKITIGMFVTSLGFAISGLLQNRLDGGTKLSVLWQLLPYIPLEMGEVMVSVTGLEFAYANAPARMKGLVMGVWFGITGTGNLCVALLTAIIGTSKVASDGSITIPDDGKKFHLTAADQFFYYAASMLCGAIVFALISDLLMNNKSQEDAVTQAE
jgi:POT family proton-dependent oligopeptide transporter